MTTEPWPDIVARYRHHVEVSLLPLGPMLELVQFLASSKYAGGLYPGTSMFDLLLGRVANFERWHEELKIQFDGGKGEFKFTYTERPDVQHPWTRQCIASEWPHVLERVLQKRLQWFHEG